MPADVQHRPDRRGDGRQRSGDGERRGKRRRTTPTAGAADLAALAVSVADAVVGIAASGRTPYTIGAVRHAAEVGAATIGISSNPDAELSRYVDHPIELVTGPEVIAGSTRLKAGTAQKVVLNIISTIAMVRLGKTFGNLMVDVRATNAKLRDRARRIVADAAGVSPSSAAAALETAAGDVKVAIVMLLTGADAAEAEQPPRRQRRHRPRRPGAAMNERSDLRIVGMISGTSMDGIDVAVADLRFVGDTIELRPLGAASREYPAELRAGLGAVLPPAPTTAEEVCRLDTLVGQAFAEAATYAVEQLGGGAVDLIVSHGQTIFHWVDADGRACGTLQIGQPAWIAEATGIPVVADLRSRDIAAGGHGAPLASTLDELLLAGSVETAGRSQPRWHRQHHGRRRGHARRSPSTSARPTP